VGLVKKEFCILNVRYDRKEYFELTEQLKEELAQQAKGKAEAKPSRPPPVPRPPSGTFRAV
jgi:hypothetical protein